MIARILLLLPLLIPASTQYHDVKGRSGIEESYDSSRNFTSIGTKLDVMESVSTTPRRYSVAITFVCRFPGQTADLSKAIVTIFIAPDRVPERSSDNLNILPNTELRVIADDQEVVSGNANKHERKSAYISLSVETFRKIATAKKLEMAIGNVELKILGRHRDRWKNLLAELDARQSGQWK